MLSKKKMMIVIVLAGLTFACGPATNQGAVPGFQAAQDQNSALMTSLNGTWKVNNVQCNGVSALRYYQISYQFSNNTGIQYTSNGYTVQTVYLNVSYPSASQIVTQQTTSGSAYGSSYGSNYGSGTTKTFNVTFGNGIAAGSPTTMGTTMVLSSMDQVLCQELGATGTAVITLTKWQ